MLFEPVNAIIDLEFYKKAAAQSVARSFGYLAYLSVIFAVVCTIALKVKVGPVLEETFTWLEHSMPTLVYENGKVTSAVPGPTRLQHPRIPEISLMIDTGRTTPVTPADLEQAKVMAYVTSTTMYLKHQGGALEPFDFSKGGTGGKPMTIDAAFYRNAGVLMGRILYPTALLVTIVIFFFWKTAASLVLSLMALMINAMAGGALAYPALLNVTIYAQTLSVVVQMAALFLPFAIPGLSLLTLVATGVYIWLAVKRHSSPSSLPA